MALYRPYTASPSGYAAGSLASYRRKPKVPIYRAPPTFAMHVDPGGAVTPTGTGRPPLPTPRDPLTPTPGSTPTTPTGTPPATTGSGDLPPFASDPIYQQISALANQDIQSAEAAATAGRKQLAIQFGDPSALGLNLGAGTAAAAQANPFSTLKNLLRGHLANVTQLEQGMNKGNLWSSSTRDRGSQQEQTGYLGNIAGETGKAQAVLASILSQLLAARSSAEQRKADAAAAAYQRWIDAQKGDPSAKPPATPTTAADKGFAPGGNYGYDTGGPLIVTRTPVHHAPRRLAPGGNYGYDTGGPLIVTRKRKR